MAAECVKRSGRWSGLVVMAALLLLAAGGCRSQDADGAGTETVEVTIGGRSFELELAADAASRYQGLSDRESIAADGGMLFVFPSASVRTFVMRRCLVPIDIAFLGPDGRVVAMHEMEVEPYDTSEWQLRRYSSQWPAQFAIELRGGTLRTLELELGDVVALPRESLVSAAR